MDKISVKDIHELSDIVYSFGDEVIVWLRENRDKIQQRDVESILAVMQVSNTKILNILQSYEKI